MLSIKIWDLTFLSVAPCWMAASRLPRSLIAGRFWFGVTLFSLAPPCISLSRPPLPVDGAGAGGAVGGATGATGGAGGAAGAMGAGGATGACGALGACAALRACGADCGLGEVCGGPWLGIRDTGLWALLYDIVICGDDGPIHSSGGGGSGKSSSGGAGWEGFGLVGGRTAGGGGIPVFLGGVGGNSLTVLDLVGTWGGGVTGEGG